MGPDGRAEPTPLSLPWCPPMLSLLSAAIVGVVVVTGLAEWWIG